MKLYKSCKHWIRRDGTSQKQTKRDSLSQKKLSSTHLTQVWADSEPLSPWKTMVKTIWKRNSVTIIKTKITRRMFSNLNLWREIVLFSLRHLENNLLQELPKKRLSLSTMKRVYLVANLWLKRNSTNSCALDQNPYHRTFPFTDQPRQMGAWFRTLVELTTTIKSSPSSKKTQMEMERACCTHRVT